jgi:hypothetical protein
MNNEPNGAIEVSSISSGTRDNGSSPNDKHDADTNINSVSDTVAWSLTNDIISKITDVYEKYKTVPNLEVEFRIGRKVPGSPFDTNNDQKYFESVVALLESSKLQKTESVYTDTFYNLRNPVRKSSITNKFIKKTKLCTIDLSTGQSSSGLAVRISFSTEAPVPPSRAKIISTRHKDRKSWIYKNWSYDLTVVKQATEAQGTTEADARGAPCGSGSPTGAHEIEIEIVDPTLESDSYYTVESTMLKIQDLLNVSGHTIHDYEIIEIKEYS